MLRTLLVNRPTIARIVGKNVRLLSSDAQPHVFQKIEMNKRDGKVTSDDFNKKAVLLYFSASWCPSCREFTPKLKEFYEHTKNDGLQVVWLSRDRSEDDLVEYYKSTLPPWPYLPFGSKEINDFLQIYKIQTIPAIKLISPDGEVADDGARVKIEKNHTNADESKKIVAGWKQKLGISE